MRAFTTFRMIVHAADIRLVRQEQKTYRAGAVLQVGGLALLHSEIEHNTLFSTHHTSGHEAHDLRRCQALIPQRDLGHLANKSGNREPDNARGALPVAKNNSTPWCEAGAPGNNVGLLLLAIKEDAHTAAVRLP
jgi:hypothetical protein